MNFHLDYTFHPWRQIVYFRRFKGYLKKQRMRSTCVIHAHTTFRLINYMASCVRLLKAIRLFILIDADLLTEKLIRKIQRFQKNRSTTLVVDAKDQPLRASLAKTLIASKLPVIVNHCPVPIDALRCNKDDAEEWLTLCLSLACHSEFNYKCQFTSCLGHTVYINDNGECRNCPHQEKPIGMATDKGIAERIADNDFIRDTLKREVPFRQRCIKSCGLFGLCKGRCPFEEDRCMMKDLSHAIDEAKAGLSLSSSCIYDQENAICDIAFRK